MQKPDFRYWVLWLFLLGVLVIVFLQVISGYNINRLIGGNRKLLNELQLQKNLRQLQSDVIILESDIRGSVINNDTARLKDLAVKVYAQNEFVAHPDSSKYAGLPPADLKQLFDLIQAKNAFNLAIIQTFITQGRQAAETYINSHRGQHLRGNIQRLIASFEVMRQDQLKRLTASTEATGARARVWGVVITLIALTAVVLAFWYTVNQGRQQQRMIDLLNQSEKRSKEVAYMKEQFLANMSHEIRTPMNSILGFTNLIRRTQLSPEQMEYIQNIHSAGENLLTLVNDILDLSKIEAGMMHLEEVRFSLNSLVSSVSAMFREKIRQKGLSFTVDIDQNIPDILSGDAVRLTQILVNLLSNAVKFTEEGGITLKAELVKLLEDSVRLRIIVSDTGIGIAPDKVNTVFERFQQAEAETTRRFGGTGLGLSIVKQLVLLQHGSISLKSELNRGSAFRIELPYNLPDIEQLYTEALAIHYEPVSLKKIRVLIAEDNPMNQQLIAHLMRSWGIEHTIVETGKAVLDQLKKEQYTLILMDIQMPEMDGYDATILIRKELQSDIPIIAMTAHAMIGEKEKCLQLGMNDYVSKPIRETILYNVISRYAQHHKEQDPAEAEPARTYRHLKLEYLHELSGGDEEFEKQILEQFVIQAPEELADLEGALTEGNADRVRRLAHGMKSTVAYVGLAEELHPVLHEIEDKAARKDLSDLNEYLTLVKEKLQQTIAEVEGYLGQVFNK